MQGQEAKLIETIQGKARELANALAKVLAYTRDVVDSDYWAGLERARPVLGPIWEDLRLVASQPLTAMLLCEKHELKSLLDDIQGDVQSLVYVDQQHTTSHPPDKLAGNLEEALSRKANVRVACSRSLLADGVLRADTRINELVKSAETMNLEWTDALERVGTAERTMQDLLSEASEALEAARQQAAHETVHKYGESFREAAAEHRRRACRAMVWSIFFGSALALGSCALVFLALGDVSFFNVETDTWLTYRSSINIEAERVRSVAPLLIPAAAVLSLALIIAVRILLAERHNQTLCEHKQRALESFEAFLAATGDARIKDAVLAHVASAIYGNVTTGYAKGPLEVPHPPFSIVANVTDPADRP